jgi:hypothetical protein
MICCLIGLMILNLDYFLFFMLFYYCGFDSDSDFGFEKGNDGLS